MNQFLGLNDFLAAALREDVGTGDITTLACVPESAQSEGVFRVKAEGVIAGLFTVPQVFALIDASVIVTLLASDGNAVKPGDIVAKISGPSRSILTGERVALNLLQHLSGIATQTAKAAASVGNSKTRIVDTRKTSPGMRELEKYAVRAGGGANHRFGLSDGVLIKDNHIKAAGSITAAVTAARRAAPHTLKIEVECETSQQVSEALEIGADIIMLDNMSCSQMTAAVNQIAGRALVEASGNMAERDLSEVAATGVDFISIGGLTHSVTALDISLKF